jgi:hypothetical protein
MDQAEGDEYTPREMAFCAVESDSYADAIGALPRTPPLLYLAAASRETVISMAEDIEWSEALM